MPLKDMAFVGGGGKKRLEKESQWQVFKSINQLCRYTLQFSKKAQM